jgi:hypothetical protein
MVVHLTHHGACTVVTEEATNFYNLAFTITEFKPSMILLSKPHTHLVGTQYETATATCQMVPLSEGLWHPLFICDPSWSYAKFTVTVNCHKDLAGLL